MIWDLFTRPFVSLMKLYKRPMPQRAGFVACLCQRETPNDYLLFLCCYPLQLEMQHEEHVKRLSSNYFMPRQGNALSKQPGPCDEDKLFAHLSDAFIVQAKYAENLFLQ